MWPNTQESADLVTFTEDAAEILNGKLHFLCSAVQKVCHKQLELFFWASYNSLALNLTVTNYPFRRYLLRFIKKSMSLRVNLEKVLF